MFYFHSQIIDKTSLDTCIFGILAFGFEVEFRLISGGVTCGGIWKEGKNKSLAFGHSERSQVEGNLWKDFALSSEFKPKPVILGTP